MLVLTRKLGEQILIGDDIIVEVMGVKNNQVKIGVHAPQGIEVDRPEIREKKLQAKEQGVDRV